MNIRRALRLVASSVLVIAAGLLPTASRAVTVSLDAATGATRGGDMSEVLVPLEDANALISPARSEDVLWHRLVVLGAEGRLMPDVIDTLRTLRDSGAHSRETTMMALEPLHLKGFEAQKAVDLARAFLEKRPVAWEFVDVDGERLAEAEWLMSQGVDPDEAAWRADNEPMRAVGAAGAAPDEASEEQGTPSAAYGHVGFEGEVGPGLKDPAPMPNAICRNCPQFDALLTPASVYRTIAGSLGLGDCKIYRMTVVGGRAYRATFCEGGGSAAFDTALEVKNGTCSVIAANNDFCAGGKSQVDFSASANGYVYIKVFSQSGAGGQFVMAYRETGAAQQGCTTCPNFDYGVFAPTSSWQTHSSTLATGSCRMYKFSLRPGRSYVFTFCQGGGTADFDTRIETFFNNCTSGPFNDDACAGGLSEVIVNSNTSQYFYVRVAGTVVGTGNYTLAYRENLLNCKTCPDYDFGTFTPTSTEQLHAASMLANGCRMYSFYLSNAAIYRFSLCTDPLAPFAPTNGSATFDSTLELFSPACASISTSDNACGDDAEIITAVPVSGIYYLKVGTTGASGSYVLSYIGAGAGTCQTCPSFDAALGTPTPVYQFQADTFTVAGDCKIYQFTLTANLLYEFTLCPPGSAAFDSILKIQDSTCASAGTVNNSACGDDAQGTVISAAGGTYYVTVAGAPGATGAFSLAYRQVPPQCLTCPAVDGTLAPTPVYQTVSGSFAQQSDCRIYGIPFVAGVTYEFTTCAGGGSAAFNSFLEVGDPACGVAAVSSDTCGDDDTIVYLAPTTGNYFVALLSLAGQGNFVLAYREVPIVCPVCPAFTSEPPPPTTSYQNVFGSIDVAGDCRIYRVALVANNAYEFTFCAGGGSAPTLDTVLSAQDPGCFPIGVSQDDFCGDDAMLTFIAPTTGSYYVRVSDFAVATGAFALAYRQVPPPCTACPASDATLVAPTTVYQTMPSALTVAGECKVFDVTLAAGLTYEFTFCAGGGSAATFDSVLELSDSLCAPTGTVTADACGDDDSAVVVPGVGGQYFVKVSANAGGVGPFTLAYREVPVTCPTCPATTGALLAPTTTYQLQAGSLDAAGDCRVYSVALFAGKAYDFTLCAPGSAATFDSTLQLLDSGCVDTLAAVADTCGDDDSATIVVTADATYYVRVAANANGIGPFNLAYREIPVTCQTCPAFDQVIAAPNAIYQTASSSLVAPGDCRIFQVPLTAGGTYEFTFCAGGASAPFDSVLAVQDSACGPIGTAVDDSCGDDAQAIAVANTTGNYYVTVSANAGGTGAFTLAYRQLPVTCVTCPASDAVLAAPTLACQTQTGTLSSAGDCRIYEVPLVAGTAYEFTFCNAVCASAFATFDSVIGISNAACVPVGSSIDNDCGDDAQATVIAAATENHYVKVSANANGIGDFELAWRELAPTCTTCPSTNGTLAAPTIAYQTQAGTLVIPGDCNTFGVDLIAGKTYELTFCTGGGSAAFNSALELSDGACTPVGVPNNAACGDDAKLVYQATATQTHYIRVYSEDVSVGAYTLAYREVPAACTGCPGFDASLNAPRAIYQTVSGTFVTGADCRTYRVGLTVGRTYEFTFCAGGGSASFNTALTLQTNSCVPVGMISNDECGDDARAVIVAGSTSFHRVTVSSQDGSIGNYTLAYREILASCKVCPAFDAALPAPTLACQMQAGSLAAAGDCRIYSVPLQAGKSYEFTFCPTACPGVASNCCSGGDGVGCNDNACEAVVCGADSFCCSVAWDAICNNEAVGMCGGCPVGPPTGGFAQFDSVLGIRNAACVPVGTAIDDACGVDAKATVTAAATQTYYVRVSAKANGIGNFSLAWREVP